MKWLLRRAAAYASPYPTFVILPAIAFRLTMLGRSLLAIAGMLMIGIACAFAQAAAPAPIAGDWLGGLVSLWGPLCGVLVALVVLCDRIAKVIPNSTTSSVAGAIRKICAIVGLKVADAP